MSDPNSSDGSLAPDSLESGSPHPDDTSDNTNDASKPATDAPDPRKRKQDANDTSLDAAALEKVPKLLSPVLAPVRFFDLNQFTEAAWKACVTLDAPFEPEGKCRLVAVRFNTDRYNTTFADGITIPRYLPIMQREFAFRTPWVCTPFGYEPQFDPKTASWTSVLRLTFDECPEADLAAQYVHNLKQLREWMCDLLMVPTQSGKKMVPLLASLKDFKEDWDDPPHRKNALRLITPVLRAARTEGFPDYQKVMVATQRANPKLDIKADIHVTRNVAAYEMDDLENQKPLSSVTKDHLVQVGMTLKHIALQDKVPMTFEARQVKFGLRTKVLSPNSGTSTGCVL